MQEPLRQKGRMPAAALLVAGLMGAGGLVLQALAAHAGGGPDAARWLASGGGVLLFHAPAVLVVTRLSADETHRRARRTLAAIAAALAFGALLFAGSLAARAVFGLGADAALSRLTPIGGALAIGGWFALALFGLARLVSPPSAE